MPWRRESSSRIANSVRGVSAAIIGLVVVGFATNVRLAGIAAITAAAVWNTRVRYSAVAALALLAVIGCLSIVWSCR